MSEDLKPGENTRAQIRDILEHFEFADKVPNEALFEYCTRKGVNPISSGTYEDWLAQYRYDTNASAFVPAVLTALARFKHISELATQKEREDTLAENTGIVIDICALMEKHEVLHKDFSTVAKDIATRVTAIMASADTRINNMATEMLTEIAEEKLGAPLTVKALGEFYRQKHPVESAVPLQTADTPN